ncbi:StfH/YfcO family fimbrial adhesin [Escherichia coli]|uniref:StfH/YfcO family fimbrial adhesin n=1 Tax=Escherichia coli TaxID=562 RepID=UPI000CFB8489|nr:StfH/YfcO family fimbrial adhesin [Escherichia coli]
MKKIHHLVCLLVLMLCTCEALAATKIATLHIPAGVSGGTLTEYRFNLSVLTPESVDYGVYESKSLMVTDLPNVSWTRGPSNTAPILKVESFGGHFPEARCPGIREYDNLSPVMGWGCNDVVLGVYYDGDLHGCPWLVSAYVISRDPIDLMYDPNIPPYTGAPATISSCPTVSLAPYDVSWNENYVVHNKVVRLQSTGGVIEQTLPTFLMENGKLCDGSNLDERGAYCRFVSQQMTFSTSGCDNAKVTVTAEQQPVTSRQLHDMKLRVDTTSRQPIDSTCRFTYILNMY